MCLCFHEILKCQKRQLCLGTPFQATDTCIRLQVTFSAITRLPRCLEDSSFTLQCKSACSWQVSAVGCCMLNKHCTQEAVSQVRPDCYTIKQYPQHDILWSQTHQSQPGTRVNKNSIGASHCNSLDSQQYSHQGHCVPSLESPSFATFTQLGVSCT